MEQDKRTLVESMIQGNESAFDELYRSCSGKLYRMAYFITGNRSESEDIVQETFLKCFLNKRSLKCPEYFESWLYQIMVRTALKSVKRKKNLSLDGILDNEDDTGMADKIMRDEADGPLEYVLKQESCTEIFAAVSGLNIKYRTVVLLYYYNGLSTREIARITGTLEGTVKSRLFKARKLLRNVLETQKEVCHEQ